MKKKHRSLLAACAAAALLAGCAGGHTHQMSDTWKADLTDHWKVCSDCGQAAEKGAHTLDDFYTCTVCGAQVIDWGDSQSLWLFAENGDPLQQTDYDPEGNVLSATIYEYEYDEQGNMTHSVCTVDGAVNEECTYTLIDGENVLTQYIAYMDDGSKSVGDYDAYGNVTHSVYYDAQGNVESYEDSEYALDEEGAWYKTSTTAVEADGSKYVAEYSPYDQTGIAYYDADGSLLNAYVWAYTYDEEGNWQTKQEYYNGFLTVDIVFATVKTEDGSTTYPQTVTEYDEDGTSCVTVYDENDEVISQTHYGADGAILP